MTAITTESADRLHASARASSRVVGSRGTLGVCWVVYGILRIVMAVILAVSSGTATVMFGTLLSRVADPYSLMSFFHFSYLCFILLSGIAGVMGILAGLALMGEGTYARNLAVLAAILSVSEIPFGTTLGVFTLVALPPDTSRAPH